MYPWSTPTARKQSLQGAHLTLPGVSGWGRNSILAANYHPLCPVGQCVRAGLWNQGRENFHHGPFVETHSNCTCRTIVIGTLASPPPPFPELAIASVPVAAVAPKIHQQSFRPTAKPSPQREMRGGVGPREPLSRPCTSTAGVCTADEGGAVPVRTVAGAVTGNGVACRILLLSRLE